jgi:hypothetical protein
MHGINNIEMVECMVFGKRAKNSRCIHALHVQPIQVEHLTEVFVPFVVGVPT